MSSRKKVKKSKKAVKKKFVRRPAPRTVKPLTARKVAVESTIVCDIPVEHIEDPSMSKKVDFQNAVIGLRQNGLTWMEAIQEYCEIHNIDADTIPKLLTPKMQEQLYVEAREYNLIKRENTLPF